MTQTTAGTGYRQGGSWRKIWIIKLRELCHKRGIKRANRTSHRYNRLPLLSSDPGGIQQELVVPICRCKANELEQCTKYYRDREGAVIILSVQTAAG